MTLDQRIDRFVTRVNREPRVDVAYPEDLEVWPIQPSEAPAIWIEALEANCLARFPPRIARS
jgi:hypothetical protein